MIRPSAPPRVAPLLTALASAAMIGGCSTLPLNGPQAAPLPAQWQDASAQSAPQSTLNWWTGFGDPVLEALIEEGLAQGGGPRLALLRVKEARANSWLAATPFLPQASIAWQGQGQKVLEGPQLTGSFQTFAAGGALVREDAQATGGLQVRASWEVPLFARVEATVLGGRANVLLSEADVAGARATVSADIAEAYVSLRAAQNRKQAFDESLAAADQLAGILELGAQAGVIAPADAADARRLAETVRAQSTDLNIAVTQARNALAILRGKAPGADAMAALADLAPVPRLALEGAPAAPADLVRLRPDVRTAEARVLLAAADLGAARADELPRINLGGAIVANENLVGSQLPSRIIGVEFSPSISIPLWDWGARRAATQARESRFDQALIVYRDTVNAGVGDAQLSLTQLKQSGVRLEAAQKAEAAALANTRGVRAAQEAGIASIADRLRAEQQLIEARLQRIAAEEARARAAIAVYRAFGGGPPALDLTTVK